MSSQGVQQSTLTMLTSEEMAGHAEEAAEVLKSIANPESPDDPVLTDRR